MMIAYIPEIGEDREIFKCEDCGELYYMLDPGDGLPSHIGDGTGYEIRYITDDDIEENCR